MRSWQYLLAALLLLCLATSPAAATWSPPTDRSIVGVEWNSGDPSPTLRWIDTGGNTVTPPDFDDHVIWGNIKRVTVSDAGTVTRDINPRGDNLDLTGASGAVMTEIPKFYVKSEKSGNYYRWWISPDPATGFDLHPAFRMRGGTERDYIYIGSYEATLRVLDDGTLALDSRTGEQPWTGYNNNPRDGMFKIAFDGGTTAPAIGATVTGATSGTSGQLVDLHVASGSWGSSNAAGTFYLKQTSGSFTNGEALQVSGSTVATANTATANAGIVATLNDFEGWGNNIGSGWGAMNVWSLSAIKMLYLVEHATWASQETTGLGIVSKAIGTGFAGEVTGFGNIDSLMGEYGTWGDTSTGFSSVSYRTMTDLWGNSWEWITGYTSTDTEYQITKRDGTGSLSTHPLAAGSYESSEATPLGAGGYVQGYWPSAEYESLLKYQFIPRSATGGSETSYSTDYYWSHRPGRSDSLLAGGGWYNGWYAGLGCLSSCDPPSESGRYRGARLEFVGPSTLNGAAPVAQFTQNTVAGNAPLTVAFTDTSTGSPSWWKWDFGDGNISTEQHPTHTYAAPGTYEVTLTAYTLYGEDTAETRTVTVTAPKIWLDQYDNRFEMKISADAVDEDLTDFPVMLTLSRSAGTNDAYTALVFDELRNDANRKKIMVTDAMGNPLYVEIKEWDTAARTAYLWVKVPHVSSHYNTVLHFYYDRDVSDNTQYVGDTGEAAAQQVWTNGYAGVWHTPSGGQLLDSSPNGNHGTIYGATETDGPLGRCLSLDGVDDWIDLGDDSGLQNFSAKTLTIWIRGMAGYTGSYRKVYDGSYWASPYGDQIFLRNNQNRYEINLRNTSGKSIAAGGSFEPGGDLIIGYVWDGTTRAAFANGVIEASAEFAGTLACSSRNVTIGRALDGYTYCDGLFLYIEISRVARSPAWIAAQNAVLTDTFVAYDLDLSKRASTTFSYDINNATYLGWLKETNETGVYLGIITSVTKSMDDVMGGMTFVLIYVGALAIIAAKTESFEVPLVISVLIMPSFSIFGYFGLSLPMDVLANYIILIGIGSAAVIFGAFMTFTRR